MKFRIFMLLIIIFGIFDVKDADAFIFGKAMQTDTTVFHNISSTYLKGKSVFIKKYNSDNQMSGTLEFQNYSALLSEFLIDSGMVISKSEADADLLVYMDYGISTERKIVSTPRFGITNPGGTSNYSGFVGGSRVFGTVTTQPSYGITGYRQSEQEYYRRVLQLVFFDKSKNSAVYESQSISEGSTNSLSMMIRGLMVPLFDDFPGPTSSTKSTRVKFKEYNPQEWQRVDDENKRKAEERRKKKKKKKK